MARRKPKFEYYLLCDDIRLEIGNKVSYMGVYGPDIVVQKVPFAFPQLCAAIHYRYLKSGDVFSVRLKKPTGEKMSKALEGSIPDGAERLASIGIFARFLAVRIEETGTYKMEVVLNRDQTTKMEIDIPVRIPE